MATTTFNKFIPTTVFDIDIFEIDAEGTAGETKVATIDSLKIANFTQEGPTKTAIGGKDKSFILRYGKETRLEMEDAIISMDSLKYFMGADVSVPGTIEITNKFPDPIKLEGKTFFIDEKGEKIEVTFTVPRFLPDGLFNLTMEAEGDFAVFELSGEVLEDKCGNLYTITLDKYSCEQTETSE